MLYSHVVPSPEYTKFCSYVLGKWAHHGPYIWEISDLSWQEFTYSQYTFLTPGCKAVMNTTLYGSAIVLSMDRIWNIIFYVPRALEYKEVVTMSMWLGIHWFFLDIAPSLTDIKRCSKPNNLIKNQTNNIRLIPFTNTPVNSLEVFILLNLQL